MSNAIEINNFLNAIAKSYQHSNSNNKNNTIFEMNDFLTRQRLNYTPFKY